MSSAIRGFITKEPVSRGNGVVSNSADIDLSLIKDGVVFNSYPDLARQMNWKVYKNGSNSHKSQLKLLSSVCDWTYDLDEEGKKKSNKIIIKKAYGRVKASGDKRKINNNTMLKRLICKSLLEFIKNSNQEYGVDKGISKSIHIGLNELYLHLGLVNKSYFEGKKHQLELSDYLNIPIEHVNDFYNCVHKNMKTTLDDALKMLFNQRYVTHRYTKRLIFRSELVDNNTEITRSPIYADEEQFKFIFGAERAVLTKYGLRSINDLQYRDAEFRDRFYKDVVALINETAPEDSPALIPLKYLKFYYNAIELSYFEDFLEYAIEQNGKLSDEERLYLGEFISQEFSNEFLVYSQDLLGDINSLQSKKITTNAINRHTKAKKNETKRDGTCNRTDTNYVSNNEALTNAVIDITNPVNINALKTGKSK